MPQSEIHTDIARLREIVEALPLFTRDLATSMEEISTAFNRLGATWRDEEYDRFKKSIEMLRHPLNEMIHEVSLQKESLKDDVERLQSIRAIKE